MGTETIDHNTLARLVEAGAVRAAHVVGQKCNGQVKPDTCSGHFVVISPLVSQGGLVPEFRVGTPAVVKSEVVNHA